MLADSALDLFAARSAVYAAARAAPEADAAADVETAMAKALATEAVAACGIARFSSPAAAAVVEGHPLERLVTAASARGASPREPPRCSDSPSPAALLARCRGLRPEGP
jgi:alkylation response protein AidB-like acyl-CoA dehydrogenase